MTNNTLSAAERDRLIALARLDLMTTWENGRVSSRTLPALKQQNAARATLRDAGIDWKSAAAMAPAALSKPISAKASTPKASAPAKPAAAPQRAQTATEARAEMRQAIAASQGKPMAPARATVPAPAPKPEISAADTWARAYAVEAQRMGLEKDSPAAAVNAGWTAEQAAIVAVNIL